MEIKRRDFLKTVAGGAALVAAQPTLALARQTGDRREEGALLRNLGYARQDIGQYEQALAFQKKGADYPSSHRESHWRRSRSELHRRCLLCFGTDRSSFWIS